MAQLRFDPAAEVWSLHWADRNSRWRRYDELAPTDVDSLPAEIEADPDGTFWG